MPVKTFFEKITKKRGVTVQSVSLTKSKPDGVTELSAILSIPPSKWHKRPVVEKLLRELNSKGFLLRAQRRGTNLLVNIFVENQRERQNKFLQNTYELLSARRATAAPN